MMYKNIREEELKNKVGTDWFKQFDTTEILGNIDFTVFPKEDILFEKIPLLWAEAKTGDFDIPTMFAQLILTIGKARIFDKTIPPAFLGVFDFKKIAFVQYVGIQDIFYLSDFNWNVTPSNHETREFNLIKERIETIPKKNTYVYDYEKDDKELRFFIKNNIAKATNTNKIKIDKNNFISIYLRWLKVIKPIIDINWEDIKKEDTNILDSDFYLADLFVDDKDTENITDDLTIRDNLFVVFKNEGYKIAKENISYMLDASIPIKNKEIYQQFWKRYKRPPIKEFQSHITERRDLLVPQDIRERKGAFFTPQKWVELSQKYLTDYLGKNWQDEYYIWDCAAGTGNLLAGLTNKYNIFASTIDQADVKVMHERINHGANLLEKHTFKFDFLNDDFSKLPQNLQDIINDEEKRKKLIIYINPPYAETSGSLKTSAKKGINQNKIHKKYKDFLGRANHELFTQFLARIYNEIPSCKIANFSKLKNLQGSHFKDFRCNFLAKLEKLFVVPSNTFDNVKGKFPIGFFIWESFKKEKFEFIKSEVYDSESNFISYKKLYSYDNTKGLINKWIKSYYRIINDLKVGEIGIARNDVQNKDLCWIGNTAERGLNISSNTVIIDCIFFSVQASIKPTWLNDRDQFLWPNDNWRKDINFQNDCLAYALFHGQNRISSKQGINHWIPFTEQEVNAKEKFLSNFMTNFIAGKIKKNDNGTLLDVEENRTTPLEFSTEAKAVFTVGKKLWKYYHSQKNANENASLYDIREHFQGRNEKGKMNNSSKDKDYTELIAELRKNLKILAKKIEPKVFEYRFLCK